MGKLIDEWTSKSVSNISNFPLSFLQVCRVPTPTTSAGLRQTSMVTSVCWAERWPLRDELPTLRVLTERTSTAPSPSLTAPAHARTTNGERPTHAQNIHILQCLVLKCVPVESEALYTRQQRKLMLDYLDKMVTLYMKVVSIMHHKHIHKTLQCI